MLSWKAILLIAALVGLIVLSYLRNSYKNTISILGAGAGWRTAIAASYPFVSGPLGFQNSTVPYAVAYWMENGRQPTQTDAATITNLIENGSCNPTEAWNYVKCNLPYNSSFDCRTDSNPCPHSGSAIAGPSTGQQIVDGLFRYGVPIAGLALMAL